MTTNSTPTALQNTGGYELVYDALTTSDAPRYAYGLCGVAFVIFVAWVAWLRIHDRALHGGVKFLGVITIILLGLGLAYQYEQRRMASRTDVRTVEGPVEGLWTQQVRQGGSNKSYVQWEGFRVNGVAFSYARSVEQNYFHNGGSRAVDLKDGMVVRVRYLENPEDGKPRNDIVRFERARP
jgi:hypothetical protein